MIFNVGDTVRADGRLFSIAGKIQYQNTADMCIWHEYRMFSCDDRKEYWLSVDDVYREYSISTVVRQMPYAEGYHEVDRGTERVLSCWGNVDVDPGERAQFTEYEDSTEEKIISIEKWSDGKEFSEGYYLDENEIELVSKGNGASASSYSGNSFSSDPGTNKILSVFKVGIIICFMIPFLTGISANVIARYLGRKSISEYVQDSYLYTYSTSITASNGLKADVYESRAGSVEDTAKNIINGIEGYTEDVTENTEDEDDNSIGILTKKQYCLVYLSEDEDQVYVQISDRKYVYSSDEQPYRSGSSTHRFYRRHYYSRAYSSDSSSYSKKYSNSFSSFSDASPVSDGGSLNSYSSSVRQQSVSSRSSSGGGTSYGK